MPDSLINRNETSRPALLCRHLNQHRRTVRSQNHMTNKDPALLEKFAYVSRAVAGTSTLSDIFGCP